MVTAPPPSPVSVSSATVTAPSACPQRPTRCTPPRHGHQQQQPGTAPKYTTAPSTFRSGRTALCGETPPAPSSSRDPERYFMATALSTLALTDLSTTNTAPQMGTV